MLSQRPFEFNPFLGEKLLHLCEMNLVTSAKVAMLTFLSIIATHLNEWFWFLSGNLWQICLHETIIPRYRTIKLDLSIDILFAYLTHLLVTAFTVAQLLHSFALSLTLCLQYYYRKWDNKNESIFKVSFYL